jgi:hypothetical protein
LPKPLEIAPCKALPEVVVVPLLVKAEKKSFLAFF